MRARAIGLIAALVSSAACGGGQDGPPVIAIDRSACAHCGMFISEPRFAAAYRAPGAEARLFDDLGCLLDALRREDGAPDGRFWVHDAVTAEWLPGERAVFVEAARLRTPMASGLAAYESEDAARRAAAELDGRVVGALPALLQINREGGGV